MSHSARYSVLKFAVGSALLAAGCGTPEAFHETTIDGGLIGRGGTLGTGTGGGIVAGTGGVIGGTGGIIGSGGITASGGTTGTGGRGTGGATASGGMPATGGRGTGGATSSGGMTGTGGRATGGATSSGGTTGTGGRATGGATSSGGMTGTGGRATGTGGMATGVLFMDNFENGTSNWQGGSASDWTIVTDGSNVYRQGALSNAWRMMGAGSTAWTNVIIEARVKVLAFSGQSSSYVASVCGRVRDADNMYCLALRSDAKLCLRKRVGGSFSNFAAVNGTIPVNTWHTVRIQIVGSTLTATFNGDMVGAAITDSDITMGGIALGTQNATAVFDDVRVTAP